MERTLTFENLLFIANKPGILLENGYYTPRREVDVQKEYDKALKDFKKLTKIEQIEFLKNQVLNSQYLLFEKQFEKYSKTFYCVLNPFPYSLDPNIAHYIIWNFEGKRATVEAIEWFIRTLKQAYSEPPLFFPDLLLPTKKLPKNILATWFENPKQNQSVKNVKHTHLFLKLQ